MTGRQKVLKVFGILEIISAVLAAVGAIAGGTAMPWLSVVVSLLSAHLLLAAAKDASKVGGAWVILLLNLVLSVAELAFAVSGGADGATLLGAIISIIINLIGFIAANNVKKQRKK